MLLKKKELKLYSPSPIIMFLICMKFDNNVNLIFHTIVSLAATSRICTPSRTQHCNFFLNNPFAGLNANIGFSIFHYHKLTEFG